MNRRLLVGLTSLGAASAALLLFSRSAKAATRRREIAAKGYPPVPDGLAEIRAQFGDIAIPQEGKVLPEGWEAANITTATMPNGVRARVNRAIVPPLAEAVALSAQQFPGYPIRSIGGYYPRAKRLSQNPSLHSWGLAVDVNSDENRGMGASAVNALPPGFPELWESLGWTWGGRWRGASYDPMHFQWARGY
jgi:hypothetical protein